MKVLFISHYDSLYGANKSLVSLVDQLRKDETTFCHIIIQKEGEISAFLKSKNIPFSIIPFRNEVGHKVNYIKGLIYLLYNFYLCFRNYRLLNSQNFDLIHTNSSISFFGCYLSYLLKIPHVFHIREFLSLDYKLYYLLGNQYSNYWIRKSAEVISISKAIQSFRYKSSKVIYNGIIDENEQIYREIKDGDLITASIIGHINPGKNQLEAIKLIEKLGINFNIKLNIVGSGDEDYKLFLENYVKEKELGDSINFLGYQNDVKPFFLVSDLVLMCSLNEGLGRVTVEAMSYGAIVLGFNNGGTSEIIKDGYNGFLYNNFEELVSKTENCLSNQDLFNKIRANAMKNAKENFSIQSYSSKIMQVYKDILYEN